MKITSEAKLFIAMAAIVLAGGGYLIFGADLSQSPTATAPAERPKQREVSKAEFDQELADARMKGPEDARYTVIEFADFQCPTCRTAYQWLVKDLGTKVPVRFGFRQYPIEEMHPWAIPAALAVEAAGKQGKFWEMYTAMFREEKPEWSEDYILARAKEVGLDMAAYDAFVSDEASRDAITKLRDRAAEKGINSTPTFWVYDKQTGKVLTPIALEIFDVLKDVPGMPPKPDLKKKK